MRIMQVMAGAEHGGAETAFVDMCLALKEAGAVQHIVTRANDLRVPQLRAAGLQVDCLPFGGAIDCLYAVENESPDRRVQAADRPDLDGARRVENSCQSSGISARFRALVAITNSNILRPPTISPRSHPISASI